MKISAGNVDAALLAIGSDPEAREILLAALRKIDKGMERPGFDVREQVTGPIADAMHSPGQEVKKALKDGTRITSRYTSKIIRDFVLAESQPHYVWEPQTTRALLSLTHAAKTVLIGGAYIGDHAVLIAKQMGKGGSVHAFEPSASSADLLERNAADNGLSNIVINRVGLWQEDNRNLVLVGDDSHAHPAVASAGAEGAFPTVSIDGYGARNRLETIDLILLDIEGAEIDALKGASKYLSQPGDKAPVVLFEIHGAYTDWSNGIDETDIVKLLREHGYSVFALRDYNGNVNMAGRMIELVPLDDIYIDGPTHGFNMLATKRPEDLENGGYRLVRGVSPKLLHHRDPKLHAPIY